MVSLVHTSFEIINNVINYHIAVAVRQGGATCHSDSYISLEGHDGYISNNYDSLTVGMPTTCPWRIEADSGQHINITIINFLHDNQPTHAQPYEYVD